MILPLILIKFKPMPRIVPLFSKQLHNLFQHFHWFAIVVPHISAAYHECSSIFSTSRIGVHQFFLPFFVSSTFIIVSLFFSLFMFIHFHFVHHLFSFWHCLYMVFIVIYIYIVSSILIICNCFIFRFHHISYIYIYIVAPSQVFCFKEIRKLPQEVN